MSKWGDGFRDVWEKTEWAAIATLGDAQPHVIGAWGKDLRTLSPTLDDTIVVPAGGMRLTEQNLSRNSIGEHSPHVSWSCGPYKRGNCVESRSYPAGKCEGANRGGS
jgi:hypothetical protein